MPKESRNGKPSPPRSASLKQAPVLQRKRVRDKAAKRHGLLTAATELFASQGFDITTTREIAKRAGCAEGLIHRYFGGKSGLLPALIEQRMEREARDMSTALPLAPTFAGEFLQLVSWEVDRMWKDRDFLRVIIPRALVDSSISKNLNQVRTAKRTRNIAHRLRHYSEGASLPKKELEAMAAFVGSAGLLCGFMRPAILGHSRYQAKVFAVDLAKLLLRSTSHPV